VEIMTAANTTTTASGRCALVATILGFGVVQLDVSVVNVAIKPIGTDLHGSVSGLQWVVDAYTVALAALILSAGALGDRLGAKRVYVAGFALFTVASVACALAPSLPVLLAARAVQGVGAAVLIPGSLTLLNHAYPDPHARATAVGLWAAGASVALSAGPLLGGLLTSAFGWRSIFFINAPLGVLGIALTVRYATETTRAPDRPIDLRGQLLAAVGLLTLAGAMVEGGRRGFGDAVVLAGFGLAAAAATAFVLVEARQRHPMLPLALFRSRTFAAASSVGLLINIAFYGLIFVLSLYFQTTRGLSVLETGLAFGPTTIAVGAGNLFSGRISRMRGAGATIRAGALLAALSLAGLLAVTGAHTGYAELVTQLVVLGFGLGILVPAMTSALLGAVDTDRSGVAAGTLNTARQTGSVIGVAVFGSLAAGHLVSGLRAALAISVVVAAAVCALGFRIEPG
jgi:DHA2 family methylenomycin A resistance protein-like MFS transporter